MVSNKYFLLASTYVLCILSNGNDLRLLLVNGIEIIMHVNLSTLLTYMGVFPATMYPNSSVTKRHRPKTCMSF